MSAVCYVALVIYLSDLLVCTVCRQRLLGTASFTVVTVAMLLGTAIVLVKDAQHKGLKSPLQSVRTLFPGHPHNPASVPMEV